MEYVRCYLCGDDEYAVTHKHRNDKYSKIIKGLKDYSVKVCVCKNCGFVYQNPRLEKHELKELYAEKYRLKTAFRTLIPTKEYLDDAIVRNKSHIEFLEKHIDLNGKGKKVLDIGCAAGTLLTFFKQKRWDCYGVEPTKSFAEFSRKEYGLKVFTGIFEDIMFDNLRFDLVTFTGTLEHILDPISFLQKVKEILKGDGFIYFEVPNIWKPSGYLSDDYFCSHHIYTFSPASLTRLLTRAGFYLAVFGEDPSWGNILGIGTKIDKKLAGRQTDRQTDDWLLIKKHISKYKINYLLKIHWKDLIKNAIAKMLGKERSRKLLYILKGE